MESVYHKIIKEVYRGDNGIIVSYATYDLFIPYFYLERPATRMGNNVILHETIQARKEKFYFGNTSLAGEFMQALNWKETP